MPLGRKVYAFRHCIREKLDVFYSTVEYVAWHLHDLEFCATATETHASVCACRL